MGHIRAVAVGALVLATAVHSLAGRVVMAEGAVAVGLTENPRDGSAYGYAYDMKASDKAAAAALEECRAVKVASDKVKSRCKIVKTFKRECVAVALTPVAPGFGWAVHSTKEAAERSALAACQKSAGKSKSRCKIDASGCDAQEKHDQ